VTLSSIVPADFPPSALRLPRTASGDDFNLLASRARCMGNLFGRAWSIQGVSESKMRSEREFSSGVVCSTERDLVKVKAEMTDRGWAAAPVGLKGGQRLS
jgi:hypothetical protein